MMGLWIFLTAISIAAQIPHAYWAIDDFSIIKNKWIRVIQNASFCLIISLMCMGFVLEGLHWHALGMAVLDIVINFYYFQRGMKNFSDKNKKEKWLRYVLAVVLPLLIYVSATML